MVGGLSLVLLLHVLLRPPAAAQYRQDNDRKQEETPRGKFTVLKLSLFFNQSQNKQINGTNYIYRCFIILSCDWLSNNILEKSAICYNLPDYLWVCITKGFHQWPHFRAKSQNTKTKRFNMTRRHLRKNIKKVILYFDRKTLHFLGWAKMLKVSDLRMDGHSKLYKQLCCFKTLKPFFFK